MFAVILVCSTCLSISFLPHHCFPCLPPTRPPPSCLYKQPALMVPIPRPQIASTKDCVASDPAAGPTKWLLTWISSTKTWGEDVFFPPNHSLSIYWHADFHRSERQIREASALSASSWSSKHSSLCHRLLIPPFPSFSFPYRKHMNGSFSPDNVIHNEGGRLVRDWLFAGII